MEEKTKIINFTSHLKKSKNLLINDKDSENKLAPTKSQNSLPENFYDIETIYKNKELNKFKDDVLSYLRARDYFYMEKINSIKSQSDKNERNYQTLNELSLSTFNSLTSWQTEVQSNLEKLSTIENFVNKANDKLVSHDIRINCLREDLSKNVQKYDKIYLDNLEVPGYIGRCSKYPNCKIFFTELIKNVDKLNTYKEKNTMDLCSYKERLENIIKNFQSLVDNNNDSQIKYITKLNEKTNKDLLETLEEKLDNVRMDNSRFAKDLINKTSELNHLYEKIVLIKEQVLSEFESKSENFNKKVNEINKSFDLYKIEYGTVRKKFLELSDFIKSGKFSKNFGGLYGKKDINVMSKRLAKDGKETIEAKDVKLLQNLEEIDKTDYKSERINTNKESKNNNNNNNQNMNDNNKNNILERMSKSQNNFHINKNSKKRKNFGFMRDIEKNIMANQNLKNQNSINASNNIKVHQGAVFYIGENKPKISKNQSNTIVAVDRQTIISKKINNDKKIKNNNNNNSDLEDIHIEKIETNIRKTNNIADELSISESCISNINNSVNTFSTTNDKNNSNNSLINLNLNKNCNKFNLLDDELKNNDKIIKELASELEQSTAKVNKLASNKKEIEDNFKNICNKIQPINLKLNNTNLEQIPEHQAHIEKEKEITESINKKENINISVNIKEPADQKEKNRYSITSKSELNTTIVTKNEGNNNTFNTNNNNNNEKNSSRINKDIRSTKSKMTLESKDKKEENTSLNTSLNTSNNLRNSLSKSIKGKSFSKYSSQNHNHITDNNILLNETINSNIDKKMNVYDKKLGDLETFTKEQIYEIMKQLTIVKKAYTFVAGILKKDKLNNNMKLVGHNTAHNIIGPNNEHVFNNFVNNENRNILNISGTNFHRKAIKCDNNSSNNKYNSNGKFIQTMDDINLNDNLFYNGKYYFNIKDILDKNNIILNSENKKLLKKLENKLQEETNKNINNTPNPKSLKNNNSSSGDKWVDLKRTAKSINKHQKPESAEPLFKSE
jgi:hypothetical protein